MSSIDERVEWIKKTLKETGARGVVLGNSGGKDCALVQILCRMATPNVLSVIMPCESRQNYTTDKEHAILCCEQYDIDYVEIDITKAKLALKEAVLQVAGESVPMAYANMNPRLRMTALYTLAQSKGYLVAGTGNLSEYTMGYFTKWGDGAYDFNPIDDMTAGEVFAMLREMGAPSEIIDKKPSAGLYDGQTDEAEMGVSYDQIDAYIKTGVARDKNIIESAINRTAHKRKSALKFSQNK